MICILSFIHFILKKITGVNKIIGERAKCSCKQNFVICGVLLQSRFHFVCACLFVYLFRLISAVSGYILH